MKNALIDLVNIAIELSNPMDLFDSLITAGYPEDDILPTDAGVKSAAFDCSMGQLADGTLEASDIFGFLADFDADEIREAGKDCGAAPESIEYIISQMEV